MVADTRISHWALILDHQAPSFRHKIFEDYKGHRPPMPEDLRDQLNRLPELASWFGINTWQISGVEADDTIASLATACNKAGAEVWLATSDKDLDQLLHEDLFTWDPFNDRLRGVHELWQERGIRPDQVCDWLCMVGDSADNIPGIKGIGCKGAAQLLETYDTLAGALTNRSRFTPRRQQACEDFLEREELIRELVTIRTSVDLSQADEPFHIDLVCKPPQIETASIRAALTDWGIPAARICQRLPAPRPKSPIFIESAESLRSACEQQMTAQQEIHLAFSWRRDNSDALQCALCVHEDDVLTWSCTADELPTYLDHLLAPSFRFVVEDLLGACAALPTIPIDLIDYCCHTAQWLCDPNEEVIQPSSAHGQSISLSERARSVLKRHHRLLASLEQRSLTHHYTQKELNYRKTLAQLNRQGVPFHQDPFFQFCDDLNQQASHLAAELRQLAGARFNPRRSADVAHFLFNRCKITPVLANSHGPRCDDLALRALPSNNEYINLILDERHVQRFITSSAIHQLCPNPDERGIFHVNPMAQRSRSAIGETAHRNAFIQSLPEKDHQCCQLRRAIISENPRAQLANLRLPHGRLALLSQVSKDELLTDALQNEDPWRYLAAIWLNRAEPHISPRDKRLCADGLDSFIYSRQPQNLRQNHAITTEEACILVQEIAATCPKLSEWIQASLDSVERRGWVETTDGRRVWIPAGSTFIQRQAMDILIDGSLHDFSLSLFQRAQNITDVKGLYISQDEWLFEVPNTSREQWQQHLFPILGSFTPTDNFQLGFGQNWYGASTNAQFNRVSYPQQRMTA